MDSGEASSSLRNEINSAHLLDHKAEKASVKAADMEQLHQPSNSRSSDDEMGALEDVTICDVCGDAGREDLLVVCSKCSDGAEHTYCMRTRLDEVPDEWICEDCMNLTDDKRSQPEIEKSDESTEGSILKQPPEVVDMSEQSVVQTYQVVGTKSSGAKRNRGDKESSLASAEATIGIVDPALLTRKRAFEPEDVSTRSSKALKTQDTIMKQNAELSLPNDGPSRKMRQNGSLPPVAAHDLSKSNQQLTEDGGFTKSKSFSVFEKRPKTQLLDKHLVNQKRKTSAIRSLRKSVSFGDSGPSDRSLRDTKSCLISPKVSELRDLKRSRSMRTGESLETVTKPELGKPSPILSPDGRPIVAVSSDEKKLRSSDETRSVHGSKHCDLRNAKESGLDLAIEVKKVSSSAISSKSKEHIISPREHITSPHEHIRNAHVVRNKVPVLEKQQSAKNPDFISSGVATADERSRAYCSEKVIVDSSTPCLPKDNPAGPVLDVGRMKHMHKSSSTDPSLLLDYLNANQLLAVPMFDYIWKGEFEVQSSSKGGRLPRLSYRIQAYLSSLSSPKIPEVVKEFPDKVVLDEVSLPSTWPRKFLEHPPQDDSIGLYFFAEDIQSYPNYKSLLRCMMDYELALKGNFNGIELLIFSSNLLPEKSQRWNNMLFLWGIFRLRKVAEV